MFVVQRKNNTKAKEKRLLHKEKQQKLNLAKAVVDKANKLTDPLEPFPIFRKFNKNGVSAELSVHRVIDLDEEVKAWAFNLTKRNMEEKYRESKWKWEDSLKYEELTDDAAWYLVAKSEDGEKIGFSHFRFDMDYDDEVLYW